MANKTKLLSRTLNAFPSRLFIMKLVPRLPTMIYFILTNLVTTFFQLYNRNLDLAHVHTGERAMILSISVWLILNLSVELAVTVRFLLSPPPTQ